MKPGAVGGLQLACSPQQEAALFMGGREYDPWPDLAKVTCPVLILEGEMSENRQVIDLLKATSLFPQGTHKLIPGAGHLLPMEKPREVVSIIKTFFNSLSD
jgi:lipase